MKTLIMVLLSTLAFASGEGDLYKCSKKENLHKKECAEWSTSGEQMDKAFAKLDGKQTSDFPEPCVRAIYPFSTTDELAVVLAAFRDKQVPAHVCGKGSEELEVWFYPMNAHIVSDQTTVWVTASPTPGGAVGTVSTYTPEYDVGLWVMSVHLDGGEKISRQEKRGNLKAVSGAMANDIRKVHKKYDKQKR